MTTYEVFDTAWRRILRDPYTGWTIILVFATAVALALIGFGYLAYTGVSGRLSSTNVPASNSGNVFDGDQLLQVMGSFDARMAEHSRLSKGYSGPADPSL